LAILKLETDWINLKPQKETETGVAMSWKFSFFSFGV